MHNTIRRESVNPITANDEVQRYKQQHGRPVDPRLQALLRFNQAPLPGAGLDLSACSTETINLAGRLAWAVSPSERKEYDPMRRAAQHNVNRELLEGATSTFQGKVDKFNKHAEKLTNAFPKVAGRAGVSVWKQVSGAVQDTADATTQMLVGAFAQAMSLAATGVIDKLGSYVSSTVLPMIGSAATTLTDGLLGHVSSSAACACQLQLLKDGLYMHMHRRKR